MWLRVVALAVPVFLPSFVLIYATHTVWKRQGPGYVPSWRSRIFVATTGAAAASAVLLIAAFAHNAPQLAGFSRILQAVLGLTAIALWPLSLIGAFFGKGTARILLICALGATLLAGYVMLMATWG